MRQGLECLGLDPKPIWLWNIDFKCSDRGGNNDGYYLLAQGPQLLYSHILSPLRTMYMKTLGL